MPSSGHSRPPDLSDRHTCSAGSQRTSLASCTFCREVYGEPPGQFFPKLPYASRGVKVHGAVSNLCPLALTNAPNSFAAFAKFRKKSVVAWPCDGDVHNPCRFRSNDADQALPRG